ncbi:MAG: hypothetical protein EHM54_11410 [Nitrospiraceae bacterium]|nr:MAG: hypothetical protein EHM54_11410 [Nitrospiraceae bacterium]
MKEDLLSEVVAVEKELARDLETEKTKAREMLDNLRQDSEREISEEEKRLQETLNQAITASVIRAEKRASGMMEKADSTAARLERTSDEVLKGIIRNHIARILP